MEVKRTTFEVEGINEPCIEVSDGYTTVRISTCYYYLGKNTLYVREYLDGEYNSEDEWNGDFKALTDADAIRIAKQFSAYIR